MINKLSKEQEEKLEEYKDKWLKIGLSTERIDKKEAIEICHKVQTELLGRKETPVVILRNPIEAWLAVRILSANKNLSQVMNQVWDQVMDQVGAQVMDQVGAQVGAQVWNQVRAQVGTQVVDQVGTQVMNQVGAPVGTQVMNQVRDFIYPWLDGCIESGGFSFYDFMQNELKVSSNLWGKYNIWKDTCRLFFIYPLENICILSEKPTQINMVNGKLHKDGGPSIKFDGDFNIWSLNGIRVPQWLAETPAEKLSIDEYKKIENADVKAEFIRKFGIERMVEYGKVIDTYKGDDKYWNDSEYQLIDMSSLFESIDYAPYLKMKNQTTGIYHMEGVHPDCKTVKDAINFRWGTKNEQFQTINIK